MTPDAVYQKAMEQFEERMERLNKEGCTFGKILNEKHEALNLCITKFESIVERIETKMSWGIIVMVLLAFLAGINTWGEFLKMLVK